MSESELFLVLVFYMFAVGASFIGSFAIAAIIRRRLKYTGAKGWLTSSLAAVFFWGVAYPVALMNIPWFYKTRDSELSMSDAVLMLTVNGIIAAVCVAGATFGYWWFRNSIGAAK